jgi:hypothetical protein
MDGRKDGNRVFKPTSMDTSLQFVDEVLARLKAGKPTFYQLYQNFPYERLLFSYIIDRTKSQQSTTTRHGVAARVTTFDCSYVFTSTAVGIVQ